MDTFQALLLLLLVLVVALLALLLHKVRRIHIASYQLTRDGEETRSLFAQLQALMALEKLLRLDDPLPPLRGWAGSPDFLWRLALELKERKPDCVLECSSGSSTLVSARCLQLQGRGHVYSLEHDPIYAQQTRDELRRRGLEDWATVFDAPLSPATQGSPWYRLDALPADLPPVEVLVVDGPPSQAGPLARLPALERMGARLAADFVLLLDDAGRADEREVVRQWQLLRPDLLLEQLPCEKGLVRLTPRKTGSPSAP